MKIGRIEYSPDYKSDTRPRQSELLRGVLDASDGRIKPLEQVREELRLKSADHPLPCPKCHQVNVGQTGEYPCELCGLPTLHDDKAK